MKVQDVQLEVVGRLGRPAGRPYFVPFASFVVNCPKRIATLNLLLQFLQGAENQFAPEGFFFVRSKFGIAGWTDDAAGGNGAHRPDFLRHRDHRADLRDRNLQFFDFFADRCAAACAGASRRGEDHAGNSSGL
jgi:hypothetical protein